MKEKKNIGAGIGPPEKKCEDIACPWHGKLPVRGRIFRGVVKSAKPHNTAIVEWGYHRFIKKYERYEKNKTRVVAHNPPCIHARENEEVVIGECRSLSKTKNFVLLGKTGKNIIEVKGEDKSPAKPRTKEEES